MEKSLSKEPLKIGDKIRRIGAGGSKHRNSEWPEDVWWAGGTIATVVEFHPAIPATGIEIDHDANGLPIFDEGLPAWYLLEIVPGATLAIGEEDEGMLWERVPRSR